ncbi:MAG TPA: hypothetical protein VFJ19_06495 [Nocardioidaceae bacterium]|nr:hypothetical protein [Nocardioidaceae bacterium]
MPRVDPDDDTLERFVVRHYRYDASRHERRHVVVAAFDNRDEFEACLRECSAALAERRESDPDVDPHEHISGTIQSAGHRQLAANGRMLVRAAEHGVVPAQLRGMELPRNAATYSSQGTPSAVPTLLGRRIRRWLATIPRQRR